MSPQITPREVVYRNRYFHVNRVEADFGDYQKEFFVNEYGRRAGLVIARENDVLLIQQYRILIQRYSWELPGGGIDPDETPEAATVREALEETGLRCRNLRPLIYFHPGLDTFNNPTHLFFTDEFVVAPEVAPDIREIGGQAWVPLTEAIDRIFAGEIIDSLTVAGLLAYHTLRMRGSNLAASVNP